MTESLRKDFSTYNPLYSDEVIKEFLLDAGFTNESLKTKPDIQKAVLEVFDHYQTTKFRNPDRVAMNQSVLRMLKFCLHANIEYSSENIDTIKKREDSFVIDSCKRMFGIELGQTETGRESRMVFGCVRRFLAEEDYNDLDVIALVHTDDELMHAMKTFGYTPPPEVSSIVYMWPLLDTYHPDYI